MREFKTLVLVAVLLAFIGGVGAGAWIGSLRAAPATNPPSVERRMKAWKERYNLTPSEQRQLRAVLVRYDSGRDGIYSELSSEQWRRLNELREKSQREIDEILKGRTTTNSPAGG